MEHAGMKRLKLLNKYSYLHSINGSLIEAELDDVSVGEVCEIYASWQANERIARAQVVGFRNGKTLLNLIGSSVGLTRTAVLKPTGEQLTIQISDAFLGSVLNASGQIMERFVPNPPGERGNLRLIDELPPSYQERRVINTPLETRIRVIDGVLTCGIGQRVGIFASAGCGKTVLMHMLVNNTEADVFVIGKLMIVFSWVVNISWQSSWLDWRTWKGSYGMRGIAEKISKCSKMCFGLCHL